MKCYTRVVKEFLHHLFIPRQSNNHRSKILHHKSIFVAIVVLLLLQAISFPIKRNFPDTLGTATDISAQELLLFTNKARYENKLPPLVINDTLVKAAALKGKDMLAKNYWAHYSPDGTTPWFFFDESGYKYTYAGENLARGFNNTEDVVKAWLASQTHRENVLSPKYRDVGFAVLEGKLNGEKTVLVVELFGSKEVTIAKENTLQEPVLGQKTAGESSMSISRAPIIDSRFFAWNISLSIIALFIVILLLDMIIVYRKKIIRLVGHNLDHIFFLSVIAMLVTIFVRGNIL